MRTIAMLLGNNFTKTIFNNDVMEELGKISNLVVNEDTERPSVEKVKQLVKDADIAITSWDCPKLDQDILDAAPKLKLVVHAAGSVKGIISDAMWERDVRISSSAEPLSKGVAETTLGLTITSLKNIFSLSQLTREGEWSKGKEYIKDIYNVTIGIISGSRVGRNYMKLLKNFDVNMLLYDPTLSEEEVNALGAKKVELDELMRASDLVSVHAPSIPATDGMINKNNLKLMKDGAILINTARSSVINEDDFVEKLKENNIFACIDVTDPEPAPLDHPFRKLPNVILTPHLAGLSNNGKQRIGNYVLSEIKRYLADEKLDGEVTLDRLSILA